MISKQVCILDYGSGNVGSVSNLLNHMGIKNIISNKDKDIKVATHLMLPGVGSFGSSMEKIKKNIPMMVLEDEVLQNKKPFLGICVGMQVLAKYGTEFGKHDGLGCIDGTVDIINAGGNPLPHIGWNNANSVQQSQLMIGLDKINDFYFVNSYCFKVASEDHIIAKTTYHEEFVSVVGKDNILGVQFHPEKSQSTGQMLIKNFLKYE